MSVKDKRDLLNKLKKAHLATRSILDKVDLEMIVYSESGWRAREILGHIATWHREVALSLKAFCEGSVYLTPNLDEDETDFNERAVSEQKKLSVEELISEWKETYNELGNAIQSVPDAEFPGDMLYPWGDERGTINELIEYMIDHEIEHQAEIEEAMQK